MHSLVTAEDSRTSFGQYVQPWQQPRLHPGCWTVAMSLSQEGQAVHGTQEVGPARATSLPAAVPRPSQLGGPANVRHTAPLLTFGLAVQMLTCPFLQGQGLGPAPESRIWAEVGRNLP